jgi:hypothetical protein
MQILVSAVNSRERKMLGVPFAAGTVGSALLRHGQTTLSAQREHLTYCHVTSTEQDKPVSLPGDKRGRSTARGIDGGAGRRSERKRMLLCNGADIGCVCFIDNITERESGQTSPWCCTRENLINRLMRQSR